MPTLFGEMLIGAACIAAKRANIDEAHHTHIQSAIDRKARDHIAVAAVVSWPAKHRHAPSAWPALH